VTVQQDFLSVTSFPRQIPPRRLPRCSPVSTVLRSHLTSQKRSCQHCPRRGSLAAQGVSRKAALHLRLMGSPAPFSRERRRVWNLHACTGSRTPPCPSIHCHKRQRQCCLLPVRTRSAHESGAPCSGRTPQSKHRELNGWPALPFARTLKTDRLPNPPLR